MIVGSVGSLLAHIISSARVVLVLFRVGMLHCGKNNRYRRICLDAEED